MSRVSLGFDALPAVDGPPLISRGSGAARPRGVDWAGSVGVLAAGFSASRRASGSCRTFSVFRLTWAHDVLSMLPFSSLMAFSCSIIMIMVNYWIGHPLVHRAILRRRGFLLKSRIF